MRHIGNDVVDLTSLPNREKIRDLRFVNRVFTHSEKQIISDSRQPDRMLWSLWAAKEAAYKVIMKSNRGVSSAPLFFEVHPELESSHGDYSSGIVKTPAGRIWIKWFSDEEYIHCLGCNSGKIESEDDQAFWAVDRLDDLSLTKHDGDSVFVRTLLRKHLAFRFRVQPDAIEIRSDRDSLIPKVFLGNSPLSVDISLSHDGCFAAIAFLENEP